MITLTQTVHPHPAVVDTALDTGETVLLHLESQTYYSLNTTGTGTATVNRGHVATVIAW